MTDSELLLGRQTVTPEQLEKLKKDTAGLRLNQASPVSADGTKTIYLTQFRGAVMAIPMQRSENGWRVDVRFWLAMRKQATVRPQKTGSGIVRARPGERVILPSGESAVGADGGDSLVLIGLMGATEVPFLLRRVGGEWKVVPKKYFEMLRDAGAI